MARHVTVWNPVRGAVSMRHAMNDLFDETLVRWPRAAGDAEGRGFVPAADAWETEDEVVIEMSLPGIDLEAVDITFEKDTLVVSGSVEARDDEKTWVLHELRRGPFSRRFNVTVPVEGDGIGASYRHGMLTLRLPKTEAVKPRKIEVKAG